MIAASDRAKRTSNPIRNIVDNLNPPKNHPAKLLNLALGDPTIHGNLFVPRVLQETVKDLINKDIANGYLPSVGHPGARQAIAQHYSTPEFPVEADDVIICSGCSGVIDLALSGFINEGDNILVPNPSFPLYQVITDSLGGHVKHYPLKPESNWECDIEAMDKLVDSRTKAILINNPSNPCGNNFSKEHLLEIAAVARKHSLPILADEIYGGLVFKGEFFPMHHYSGDVPVVSFGGLAKEFVVPGWRVGWLILHDKGTGRTVEYKKGLKSLTQIVLGANSLIQASIPAVLTPSPQNVSSLREFTTKYKNILAENAAVCMEAAQAIPALSIIEPMGAMYVMLRINFELLEESISNDVVFSQYLLQEENVSLLPGQCFGMKNFIRLVICPPQATLREAFSRLQHFCERHKRRDAREAAAAASA